MHYNINIMCNQITQSCCGICSAFTSCRASTIVNVRTSDNLSSNLTCTRDPSSIQSTTPLAPTKYDVCPIEARWDLVSTR